MIRLLPPSVPLDDVQRVARRLWVRSRREAAGLLAGEFASAFRGGGIEFEESRPYAPGDDVRSIDWNALARTGEPWVKRFREERSRSVLLALDVSASMGFGSQGRTKAACAAHAGALVAAAAGRAGDRLGLVAFADRVRHALPPQRGPAHTWRVIRSAVERASTSRGATSLVAPLPWLSRHARHGAVVLLLSDFRDESLACLAPDAGLGGALGALARRHDVVAAIVEDPRERELVAAGPVLVRDSERPGRLQRLHTGSARVRTRYAEHAAARRARLTRTLRQLGLDPVWLSTHEDPLHPLERFFRERSARRRIAR